MAKKKLSFVLGVHCHQPVGNFGWVIEEAFVKSYKPLFESISEYPGIKITAHISGPLLEWMEDKHPDFLKLIRELVFKKQVEIMGGGFYEPVLMVIPEVDRLEQIEMMASYTELKLGMRPKGIWLTERIWEPALPKTLKAAGVSYTVTDDSHFLQSGVRPENVRGYYLTEDEGAICAIFPIDQTLRYAVPFSNPEKTIKYLKSRYESGDTTCCTLIDDGEKFGLWPGTHELLYTRENWLKRFYEALIEQSDWLEITTPEAYMENNPPEGLVYLPTASYFEMGQWTLSPDRNMVLGELKDNLEEELKELTEVFIKGGFFRNFFMRYPESNHMHKRMLEISRKIHISGLEGRPRDDAKKELFQGQCNCAYWHGIFGGLYLPHLRDAIYEHLITAERIVEEEDWDLVADHYDLNLDGNEEIRLRNRHLNCFITPHDGGSLIELDLIRYNANVINTLAKRPEAYHAPPKKKPQKAETENDGASIHEIGKQLSEDDRKILVYDDFRRNCFRDFIFNCATPPSYEELRDGKFIALGDTPTMPYNYEISENSDCLEVSLSGRVKLVKDGGLAISKNYCLPGNQAALKVSYSLRSEGDIAFKGFFAVQLNLTTPSALGIDSPFVIDGDQLSDWPLLKPGSKNGVECFRMKDPHRQFELSIETETKANVAWHPVETISQSESGFDRNYQASAIWFLWPIDAAKGNEQSYTLILSIADLKK